MKGRKLKTKKKKTLVVFYSRTGNTRKVGKEIAENLKADVCEIYSNSNYKGIFGYIKAGYQAIKNKKPLIKFDKNSDDYDLIVIGTPNWGSKMASLREDCLEAKENL